VILNFKNSEDYARKYLDLVNTFSKETGLKKKKHKTQRLFYTPTMKIPRKISGNQSHSQEPKNLHRHKLNQVGERLLQ
jgi:hypothetical protein